MITAKGQGRTPGEARAPNRAKALLHAQVPVHCCWSGPLGGCSPLATSKAGLLAFKTLPWTSLLLAVQSGGGERAWRLTFTLNCLWLRETASLLTSRWARPGARPHPSCRGLSADRPPKVPQIQRIPHRACLFPGLGGINWNASLLLYSKNESCGAGQRTLTGQLAH